MGLKVLADLTENGRPFQGCLESAWLRSRKAASGSSFPFTGPHWRRKTAYKPQRRRLARGRFQCRGCHLTRCNIEDRITAVAQLGISAVGAVPNSLCQSLRSPAWQTKGANAKVVLWSEGCPENFLAEGDDYTILRMGKASISSKDIIYGSLTSMSSHRT